MNTLPSAKEFALSPFYCTKLHLFVMGEHVSVITKLLTDKQQQLFGKRKQLTDNKQHLATSSV